ncbi:MAG: ribokinase [Rubellimicrobium sp.]|nr:ribokinase [Rubellimicrobium sp.]
MTGDLLQMAGVVIDVVYRIRALPRAGDEAEVLSTSVLPGGGFNAMAAARRAGMTVRHGGRLGTGPFAELAVRAMQAEGIALPKGRLAGQDQGICTVLVDDHGERTFIGGDGANGQVDAAWLADIGLGGVGTVLVSGYALAYPGSGPALGPWLAGLPQSVTLVFDPSAAVIRVPRTLLAAVGGRADWITANADEAAVLHPQATPEVAAAALARGRRGGALVRLGAGGCILATDHAPPEHLAGLEVRAVDTNGAGDAHTGWFIAGLADGLSPRDAALRANAAAALSTTRPGPATAPTRAELDAFLAAHAAPATPPDGG